MGKNITIFYKIKLALFLMISIIFIGVLPVNAKEKENFIIRQIDSYLPTLQVYIHTNEKKSSKDYTVKASEGDRYWTVTDMEEFSNSKRGTAYYVLLDVSTSLSREQFNILKKNIILLSQKCKKDDRLVVMTFGKKVKVIDDGSLSTEDLQARLNKLSQEKKTHLYEGIDRMAEESEKYRDKEISCEKIIEDCLRPVGIILTDWQEVKSVGGKHSQEESLLHIQKTGMPLYGYCPKDASVKFQDQMGTFVRSTGGKLFIVDHQTNMLSSLYDDLKRDQVLTVQSSSNKTCYDAVVFEIDSGEHKEEKENVYLLKSEKDEIAPKIKAVEQKGKEKRTLVVKFSEDVIGADNKSNYKLVRAGKKTYTVSEATYVSDNLTYEATLTLNESLIKGKYELDVVNIKDNTNEENMLTDTWSGDLKGEGTLQAIYYRLGKLWSIFLLVAIMIILCVIYLYIKKNKGLMVVDDKMVLGSNLEKKHHIGHDEASTKEVVLSIDGITSKIKNENIQINGSIIVGRSSICDIYFDDISMSKQHFALEVEHGELFILDLNSKNGTIMNQKLVKEKTKVENGSVIEAGSVNMTVRW